MSYFSTSRNVELSLLKYLEDSLNTDWPGTSTLKSFKQVYSKDVNLPIVCVRLADTSSTRLEVGNTTLDNRYLLIVDLFTRSDSQRLDMSDYLLNKLKDSWVHYTFSHTSGSPTTLTTSANGRDTVTDFVGNSRLDFGETTDVKDKFRQTISIRIRHKEA